MYKLSDLTIIDIIERKIKFIQTDSKFIFNPKEYQQYNMGDISALTEILVDIKSLSETLFIDKYKSIIQKLAIGFDSNSVEDASLDELLGYNNAIVEVLSLLNPSFQYANSLDINDIKANGNQ